MSLSLLLSLALSPAMAQSAPQESAQTSADQDNEGAGWSGEELVPEAEAAPEPQDMLPYQSYQDGFLAGKSDAKLQGGQYGLHGLIGFGAGCVGGPCGMLGAPAIEATFNPAVPNGIWAAQSSEYQQGYVEGFQRTIQRKRVIYSFAGASVGTVIGLGTGAALRAVFF